MRFRKNRHQGDPELDMIPFLNVMVVLIAFLLLNAVFAAVSVIDVNLPSKGQATTQQQDKKPKIALEVLVYDTYMLVNDRNSGPLKRIANKDGKADVATLHTYLMRVKKQFEDITNISLLCESNTPYQTLIAVMDAVRYYHTDKLVTGRSISRPLFPDISIGSAPPQRGQNKHNQNNKAGETP